ncbi:MAG: hypothetical protein D6820_00970, partial [Lentisphaerae bacterium]
NAACSGYLYALSQVYDMMRQGGFKQVLVITAETLSRVVRPENYETYFLFGDAATASLVSLQGSASGNLNYRFNRPVLSAIPDPKDCLHVPLVSSDDHLSMNGVTVFRTAVREMIGVLNRACHESKLTVNDLDLIVPHQANARIIEAIRKQLNLPAEKVFNMIEDVANTSSNTIPVSLYTLMNESGRKLQRLGLTAFGGGFTFGSAILEKL